MRLVLASQSPARKATLISAGITPIIRVSTVDEDAILASLPDGRAFSGGSTTAHMEVCTLAGAKCEEVAQALCAPDANDPAPGEELLVIGCDSMLELNGEMVGKPASAEEARRRIRVMSDSSPILWTGHHLIHLSARSGSACRKVVAAVQDSAATTVHFSHIEDDEINAYVDSGEPLHVAGSFTLDGLGGAYIRGIEGDPHSVVGISLPLVRQLVSQLGLRWHDLWDGRRGL
ncbi:MAG: Maf family protein [Actinomycetaceae bacterium]|nr:Maf family protein [Actinomycetaceae bacterium]